MTKSLAAQVVPFVLAVALTLAMLATTNLLAGHQYHVALASQAQAQAVTLAQHAWAAARA